MNIITSNTEENEIQRLKTTQSNQYEVKSISALDQNGVDNEDQETINQKDRDEGYLGIELPVLLTTKRGKHQRGRSLLDRVKDSFFGKNELRASLSRDGPKPDMRAEGEYLKIEIENEQQPIDNQIQLLSTNRDVTNQKEIIFPSPNTPEQGIKRMVQRRILNKATIENDLDTVGVSLDDGSKFASASLSKLYTASPNVTASRNWKKLKALKVALQFTDQTNVLVDARVGKIMKGVSNDVAEKKSTKWSINPNGKFKLHWDFLVSIAICYYIFIIPWRFAFTSYGSHWNYIDLGFDILFSFDISLKFLTGVTLNGEITYDKRIIAIAYLKSQFIIDLICVVPLYFWNDNLAVIKLLRLFQLDRFAKVSDAIFAKVISILLRGRIDITFYEISRIFYKTLFLLVGMSHILNCFWIAIGFFSQDAFKQSWFDDFSSTSHTDFDIYIQGIYFIVTTITTVGFGDSCPSSVIEMIYAMFAEFFGIGLMAYFQSNVIYFVKKFDSKRHKLTENDEALEHWMYKKENVRNKPLDAKYCGQLKSYFHYIWLNDIKSLLCDQRYFYELTPTIQHEVGNLVFSEMMKHYKYFFNFFDNEEFKLSLLRYLKPTAFVEGQRIIKRGVRSKGLYFILAGNVEVCHENEVPTVILPAYSYFGDQILFDKNSQYNYKAASDIVQCLYIRKDLLLPLLDLYPRARENLEKIAMMRHQHLNRMRRETLRWNSVRTNKLLSQTSKLKEALEINPINEAQSKLEISNESCTIYDPESEAAGKNSPNRNLELTTARGDKKEVLEPNPEEVQKDQNIPPNDKPLESFAYRSGAGVRAGNIPNFLQESFVNAKILKSGVKLTNKMQNTSNDKKLLSFKPSNTFANDVDEMEYGESSIEYRQDSGTQSSEFINDFDPTGDWDLGLAANPLYPLQIPKIETLDKHEGESTLTPDVPTAQDSDMSFVDSSPDQSTNVSDNEDEMNRSLEIPINHLQPAFTGEDSLEDIVEFLKARLKIVSHKFLRIERQMRLDVIELNKKLNKSKRVHGELRDARNLQ